MPNSAPIQNNFNSGEFSGLMAGRVDFERYKTALKVCTNQVAYLQGGVTRRPSTYYCDEVKDSTKATRVVKFKYSTISAFVLEFGDQYIRFKKNRAPIYDLTLTITNISAASPAVCTYTGTDPANGDHVDLSGLVGMESLNGLRVVVSNVDAGANTFEMKFLSGSNVTGSAYGTYSSGGVAKRVYTLTSTYLAADLFQLKFAQSADVLYIWHPDYPERKLSRTSAADWTLANTTFLDGPYLAENTTDTTLTPSASAPGTGVTLTASATTGINHDTGFQSTDVGRLIRLNQGGTWGYVKITGWTSTTVVTVTVINTLTSVAAKKSWRMGLYSDTTGYPACGTFYGDRLYRGGCPEISERFDGSKVGDYDNMAPSGVDATVTDASAVSFRLTSNDVQTIRWMDGTSNGIAMGTFEGEWLVTPSTNNETITPTNVNAKQSTGWGSDDMQPVRAGQAILFVEAGGRRVREMNYLYYENTLQSLDTTVLADHITKGNYDPAMPDAGIATDALSGLVEIAYQKKKIPTLWGVRKDGVLLSLAYSKDDKVNGWFRQLLGGYSNAGQTERAKVKSCCVIPSFDGAYDETWLIVQRYINGRSVQTVEYLRDVWEQGNAQEDGYHADCSLTYDGATATTIRGLHHLAGQTVAVVSDGRDLSNPTALTVSATGTITLTGEDGGAVVHVGLPYTSDGETLRLETGSATGTAQGKLQRIHRVTFRVHDSLGLTVGPSFDALTPITFRTAADLVGQATPLFTGDKTVPWEGGSRTEATICWRWNGALPGTLLAILPHMNTQDRT